MLRGVKKPDLKDSGMPESLSGRRGKTVVVEARLAIPLLPELRF
jgi:hypothetical protein